MILYKARNNLNVFVKIGGGGGGVWWDKSTCKDGSDACLGKHNKEPLGRHLVSRGDSDNVPRDDNELPGSKFVNSSNN